MASHILFNALRDPVAADIFIDVINLRDLSVFAPLVARYSVIQSIQNPLYEWIFSRILFKRINIDYESIKRIQNPVVNAPNHFKKIYTRLPRNNNALSSSHECYYACYNIQNIRPRLHVSGMLGTSVYAYRTGWVIVYSATTPVIDGRIINRDFYCGFNYAIDPAITLDPPLDEFRIKNNECIDFANWSQDEEITAKIDIPNLFAYTDSWNHYVVLYIKSSCPQEISNTIDAINEKLIVENISDDYDDNAIWVLYPGSEISKRCMPYIFHGNRLPDRETKINYCSIAYDERVWNKDIPLFRDFMNYE